MIGCLLGRPRAQHKQPLQAHSESRCDNWAATRWCALSATSGRAAPCEWSEHRCYLGLDVLASLPHHPCRRRLWPSGDDLRQRLPGAQRL